MGANYNKLFKLMIDKKMKKGALCEQADISGTTLAKMGRGENVTVDVLMRICRVLECSVDDKRYSILTRQIHEARGQVLAEFYTPLLQKR